MKLEKKVVGLFGAIIFINVLFFLGAVMAIAFAAKWVLSSL